jgi:hypothetical protein
MPRSRIKWWTTRAVVTTKVPKGLRHQEEEVCIKFTMKDTEVQQQRQRKSLAQLFVQDFVPLIKDKVEEWIDGGRSRVKNQWKSVFQRCRGVSATSMRLAEVSRKRMVSSTHGRIEDRGGKSESSRPKCSFQLGWTFKDCGNKKESRKKKAKDGVHPSCPSGLCAGDVVSASRVKRRGPDARQIGRRAWTQGPELRRSRRLVLSQEKEKE